MAELTAYRGLTAGPWERFFFAMIKKKKSPQQKSKGADEKIPGGAHPQHPRLPGAWPTEAHWPITV